MQQFRPRRSFAPVKVGDELDVTVEAVGEKGDGVVKVKGFVLFVPGVKQGENIRIRVNKVFSKVGFAEKIGEAGKKEETTQETTEQMEETEESTEDTEDFGEEQYEQY
jgi:predicted RNA-binding protein with TRAM domain